MEISSVSSVAAETQVYASQKSSSTVQVESVQNQSQGSSQMQDVVQNSDGKVTLSKDNQDNDQKLSSTLSDMKEISKLVNDQTVAEFGYNEPTHRVTITIKDKETGEVIKEIPSEKILKMVTKAWEIAGIMVDEKR